MEGSQSSEWSFNRAGQTSAFETEGKERRCQGGCIVLLRYVFFALLGLALYASTIAVDICVALQDLERGHHFYAITNLALVATPSLLFGLYMVIAFVTKFEGFKACCNAVLWMLFIPLIPLFPLMRIPVRSYHAVAAICRTHNKSEHMSLLTEKSSAHLLKFLQALVASAPQLVLRAHKVLSVYDDDYPFANVGLLTPLEWSQVGLATATVALTVSLAVGQTASTRDLLSGSLALENAQEGSVLLALLWWLFFLASRIPCLALLIHSFDYWSLVFLVLHCPLIVALQSNKVARPGVRTVFVYLFSAFAFIFVYMETNLTRRIGLVWAPHALFSALALLEQSVILAFWFLVERQIIPEVSLLPMGIAYKNDTFVISSAHNNTAYFDATQHDEAVFFAHYALFSLSVIFMAIAFGCRSRS